MASTLAEFSHLRIPLGDVVEATNNFHDDNFLSEGEFGPAYKGKLLHSGKWIKITARRFDSKPGRGHVEFWTEISVLSDLKHINIISIIGYCDEKHMRIIITPYVANGSLKKHLDSPNLTWTQRLRISVGVARALSHLHHGKGRDYGFIHCNINSCTILLDENWEAKLSSFEISIKQSVNQTDQFFLSEPFGMIGYTDPTIEMTGCLTFKSDIYSFGVVLFEILCGRDAFIPDSKSLLAPLAKDHYINKTLHDIIHPHIWNQILSPESHKKYSKAAYSCLKEVPSDRPYMDNILQELERALELQLRHEDIGNNLKHLKIPLSDLKLATDNFSDACIVGSRSYCTFYKAKLSYFDEENASSRQPPKRQITGVIKRILPGSVFGNGTYEEEYFFKEIEVLTSVKHHGIITLHGYCGEGSEMVLVIDDFSNGYLTHFLTDINKKRTLTWEKRLKICIDVAHALNYLHYEMKDQQVIINRDINSDEIGLNENFGAKIVHFGLSRFLPPNQHDEALYIKNKEAGRPCCTDPVYERIGKLKRESDVYSFGVVMFEILFGRLAHDQIYLNGTDNGVASVARRSFRKGTISEMIDPIIKEEIVENTYILKQGPNKNSLETFIEIAFKCVAEAQEQRPTMKVVVKELETALLFRDIGVQNPNIDQVDNANDKSLKLQFTHGNNVSEEGAQCSNTEKDADTLEKTLELLSIREIPEEGAQCSNTDKDADTLEKTLELLSIREIPGISMEHMKIPLTDIKLATANFSEAYRIRGSTVYQFYKAEFEHFDEELPLSGKPTKRQITRVIKRIVPGNDFYREEYFFKEIHMLTSVKHHGIVTLHGFCFESSEMILVYDDFSCGFLGGYLDDDRLKRVLTWEKRLRICIDVARALNYLHYEMEDQKVIINCGIHTNNIVLDDNLGAKIVDFEISQFLPPNQYDEALIIIECFGIRLYRDPEYEMTGKLKRESDVYSFGVVMFEILCGRRTRYVEEGLTSVVRRSYNTRTIEDMIDYVIKEETSESNFILNRGANKDSLHTFIEIAYNCIAETQDKRPTMKVVVKELEKALSFQENHKNNPRISLENIKLATRNFHNDNCIGGGGFGRVFKGTIQDGDRCKTIVAKQLDRSHGQGEQQFLSELQILLEYKHENIIGLVGYCEEKDEKIIVYEYASRESLDKYLNKDDFTWKQRLNVCIDVASALYFLHGGFGKQAKVIHRDIKTPNILLNEDWKAKLADFGLSLISPLIQETDYVIDHACGTTGYLDPLYRKTGFLTIESDIYSFGVVLLEILCGRSTYEIKKHKGHYLPDYIKSILEEEKHDEVVFEKIRDQVEPKSLAIFEKIAYQCLHLERENRPTTKEVLTQLKKALTLQEMAFKMKDFADFQIPLEEVVKATNNFHNDNIIPHGRSGRGIAYTGQLLRSGKEMTIAARRFDCKHGEGDLEFLAEISALSDLKHTNIVSFIGFCDEGDEKIIVTKHAAIGRLWSQLDHPNLTWELRLSICVGVACALNYIHHERRDYAILHCNINSHTILLDDNLEPKLSGFEFSIKQFGYCKDQVCFCEHSGRMRRIDPAIEKTGGVTDMSDIYLFGVFLYEMLLGRRIWIDGDVDRHLASLAIANFENPETLQDKIHPYLWNQMSPSSLAKYSRLAYSCLNEDPAQRPSLVKIEIQLLKARSLQAMHQYLGDRWGHLKFRLSDIKLATNNFSETYRIGGRYDFAMCLFYRAKLDHFDVENPSPMKGDNLVVVKRFPFGDKVLRDQMFFTEIKMLMSLKHHNIVTLRGYCVEGSERILVTENISNGYLSDYLEKNEMRCILTWEKRLKICIDVAQAINYLHYEMEDQTIIINRFISSFNIGLDKNLGAKIVDFCLSKLMPPNQEDYEPRLGLLFYADPEYTRTGKLKRESDVYSFGVVMFELLCGRLADDPIYKNESDKGLADVARRRFHTRTLEDLIDPIIKEETNNNNFFLNKGPNKDSLYMFIEIAYQCVAVSQDQRPTMTVVLKKLQEALYFQENNKDDTKKGNLQGGGEVDTIVAKRLDEGESSKGE